MDIQSVLTGFCLISACITYGLGIFVLSKNTSSPVNRLFFAATLGASYWAVGEFLIWHVNGYEGALFWLKASSLWTVVIAITVHFILVFTSHPLSRRENFKYLLIFLYVPSLVFALLEVVTNSLFVVPDQPDSGFYYYIPVFDSPVYLSATLYFLLIMVGSVYLSIRSWFDSPRERIRRQCILVSIGFILVIGFGSQSVILLPQYGIHAPNLVFIGVVFFSTIIAYTILKFGLFSLGPETAATNIIRTMPDGLILTDMSGYIQTTNTSAGLLFQIHNRELSGRNLETLLPDKAFQQIANELSGHDSLSDLECTLPGEEGPVVSIAGSLVRDPEGDPAGYILIIRNITARKTTERALTLANEKISLLNRLTRHDITNLITPLLGYLSLMREEEKDVPDEHHLALCLDLVNKIAHHLKFSQQYCDVGSHDPLWLRLNMLITSALTDLSHESVQIMVTVRPVMVYADPLIQKVIYNLLENAIRHGGKITRISIATRENQNGDLILSIEDDGDGIRDEEKDLLFLHGYGKNSGLGLTISCEILAVTGMSITETGVFGSGARFEIIIPASIWKPEESDP